MLFSNEDNDLITQSVRVFGSIYGNLSANMYGRYREIVAVRYALGMVVGVDTRHMTRVLSFVEQPTRGRVLLAKLRASDHVAASTAAGVVVTTEIESLLTSDLRSQYQSWRRRVDQIGAEPWHIRDHEYVVTAMYARQEYHAPSVFTVQGYISLLHALEAHKESLRVEKPPVVESDNGASEDSPFLRSRVMYGVASSSSSRATTCYTCGVTKAAQIQCIICGRLPRSR